MNLSSTDSNDSSLFGLSPPHDGSEMDLMSEDMESLFPDLSEITTTDRDAKVTNRHPSVSGKKPIIQIKVPSSQGGDLIKYITGKFDKNIAKPVMHLLQNNEFGSQSQNNPERHSPTSEFSNSFEAPCMSKNAVAARENRLKKKMYVHNLESAVKSLRTENEQLNKQVEGLGTNVEDLTAEVKYLKAVIANQGTISALLSNIHKTKGVKLSSSLSPGSICTRSKRSLNQTGTDGDNPSGPSPKRTRSRVEHQKENIDVDTGCFSNDCVGTLVSRDNHGNEASRIEDHSYTRQCTTESVPEETQSDAGGVCLHVSGKSVSLEFCASCSRNASVNGSSSS